MTHEEIIERVLTMTEDERKEITRIVRDDLKQQCAVDFNDDQVVDYCLFYVAEVRNKIVHVGPMREANSYANELDKVLGKKPRASLRQEMYEDVCHGNAAIKSAKAKKENEKPTNWETVVGKEIEAELKKKRSSGAKTNEQKTTKNR